MGATDAGRPAGSTVVTSPRPPRLVVTDLDGTLLEEVTYSHAAADPALCAIRASAIPLVLASSKTLAEVEPLGASLGPHTAFIVENGGAVVIPEGHLAAVRTARDVAPRFVLELGVARSRLVAALDDIARETHTTLRGFAQLALEEIAALTQLPIDEARRAAQREYDEPFLLEPPEDLDEVTAAAARRGLAVTHGGRFLHLTGPTDKGRALQALLGELARAGLHFTTIGLGDSANDLSFLRVVDLPVIVPRPGGRPNAALVTALPMAVHAPWPGPEGWNTAVLAILAGAQSWRQGRPCP